jgi:hypothetical protein
MALPPGSIGAWQGDLTIAVTHVEWDIPGVPAMTSIYAEFWAHDESPEVCVRLAPVLEDPFKLPVRCGPSELASYMRDVQTVTIRIEDRFKERAVGFASVPVGTLDMNSPTQGSFPIHCPQGGRCLGKVSLMISVTFDNVIRHQSPHGLAGPASEREGHRSESPSRLTGPRYTADHSEVEMDDFLEQLELKEDQEESENGDIADTHSLDFFAILEAAFKRCAIQKHSLESLIDRAARPEKWCSHHPCDSEHVRPLIGSSV